MYEEYWKLKEKPFENNFDLRFLYLSLQHEEVLTRLLFSVREKRHGAILAGSYGSGKSLILRYFLKKLAKEESNCRVIHIMDPLMTITEFYREFFRQTGYEVENGSGKRLIIAMEELLASIQDQGGHTLFVIDEATLIPEDTLEEMRLLLDLFHPTTQNALLTMILSGPFGEEDAPDMLKSPALRQRLPLRCHLDTFDTEQCAEYIQHRLAVAGQTGQIFTDDAVSIIADKSGGAPRSINNICDLALFLGYSRRSIQVDGELVDLVTQEIAESLK